MILIAVTPLINSWTRHFSLSLNSDSPGEDIIFRLVELRFWEVFSGVAIEVLEGARATLKLLVPLEPAAPLPLNLWGRGRAIRRCGERVIAGVDSAFAAVT